MWVLLVIFFVTVPSFASKERVQLQDLPEDEKDILFDLVKRLGKGGGFDELGWQDQAPRCGVSTNLTSIIKKVDSVNNGAKFLISHKGVETNDACSEACCKNDSCDLAVFENKGDHYCYLFRCEGKCKFSHHASYISNVISHFPESQHQPPSDQDSSELDLMGLDQGSDTDDHKDTFVQTTLAAATTSSTTTAVYIRAHSVGLQGHCELAVHCEDPNAVCDYRKCRCKPDYYQKKHICRQVCPPSNFECLELGTHGRGPQCVTDVQVCDSVTQCADGSDEFNCPDTEVPPGRTWQQQQPMAQAHAQPTPPLESAAAHQQQPQQQQPFLEGGYGEPHYGYNQQGLMAPSAGQANNPGPLAGYPEQGQYYGQGDGGRYPGYGSQQSQLIPHPGQPAEGAPQPHSQAYLPRYEGAADGQYAGKGMTSFPNAVKKEPGSSQQQPAASSVRQPAEPLQTGHLSGSSQQQPQAQPAQAAHSAVPHPDSGQHPDLYPQKSQKLYQNTDLKQPSLKTPDSKQSYLNPGLLEAYNGEPQLSYQGPVPQPSAQDPQSMQQSSQKTAPQPLHPVEPQQRPAPAGHGDSPTTGHSAVAPKSRQPPPSDATGQSVPSQSQPADTKIFGAAGPETGQRTHSARRPGYPPQKHTPPEDSLPPSNSNGQKVLPAVPQAAHMKPLATSGSITATPRGPHPAASHADQSDGQRDYVVPGHGKVQGVPDSGYRPPQGSANPEQPHPHSAYDVRIGEHGTPGRKTPGSQKSFLNPTELNDLDAQGPSRFLDNFGDQYVPQQGFNQQYNPYSSYPSAYQQNSGNRGNSYPANGLSDQLYPGTQGQRVYPQQGYLDFGYPSPQYEFGEFDPPYPEGDTYPGNHDIAPYRPNSKLGYDGPYTGKANPGKGNNPQQGSSSPASQDGKTAAASQEFNPESGEKGDDAHPDGKSKPDTDLVLSPQHDDDTDIKTSDNTDTELPDSKPSDGSQPSDKTDNKPSYNTDNKQSYNTVNKSSYNTASKLSDNTDNKPSDNTDIEPSNTASKLPDNTDSKSSDKTDIEPSDSYQGAINNADSTADHSSKAVIGDKVEHSEVAQKESHSNQNANSLTESQNAFIAKVKMGLPGEPAGMEGPIIALSLGLAFTLILLIFVACRLRNVRRRLRKGRPLHSNEADYLINGMYL